ncbi:uncharacterized protein LOC113214793 [Frankliniella occidentalis]|uniref:Uncharacterized protein LOC113214793 n=1 Tax=Frankliniella occidentalis TaxID=133901 RepID=A0A6J1TEB1_FRAOC|nr:uncharacterized protein LOC113214793 [Frankliniella occidentalis]XP_026290055.2 uncharacterized protein LOC113214793 [Frankliniella occidentalis]
MLTRSRKKATMSALLPAPAPMKDLLDKMTLLSLRDQDLLQVLSHLHAKDLGAAGRASPRLAALTRSHPSLWKDLKGSAEFDNVEGLLSLLRVAPPVDRLYVYLAPYTHASEVNSIRSSREWRPPIPVEVVVITATVSVPDTKCCATVLRELGRRLEEMEISGLGRGLKAIFRSLRHATSLRSLRLRFQSYFSECDFRWPQALVLPRMHTVALDFEGQGFVGRVYDCDEDEEDEEENVIHYTETEPTLLEALRSLLLAHSQQLQHVKLQSARLLPLVDSCGSTLRQLSVEVGPWVGAELRHLRGLNRLSVFAEDGDEADATPVRRLLQTCRCPVLERLDLSLCNDQLMRDLGAGALASLQCLWVSGARASWRQESLEVALAGLPNLRSLGVLGLQGRTPGPAQMISRLSNAAIPKLGVVVFVDSVTCKSDTVTDYLGFRDLRDMVLRAPMQLHVVAVFHLWNERKRHFLFSRHSTVESVVASCTLCAEAGDIGILSEFKDIPFERIQLE